MNTATVTTTNESLASSESFDDVDTWLRVVNGVVMALILSFSIVGNVTVILLVIFHRKLKYRSVIVSMGLVVADLLVAVIWTTQSLIATILGQWPFDEIVCNVLGAFWLWILYAKWLESAVVSFDRFFIITYPFTYYKHSKPVLIILTILAWLVPLLFITPATLAMDPFKFRIVVTTCTVDCLSGKHGEVCLPYFAGLFSVFVMMGGVMPTVLYLIMYCISRQKRIAMTYRLGTQHETIKTDQTSITSVDSTTTSSSSTSSSAEQTSGGALKKWLRSRDQRALATFFIVFLTLLVSQIPLIVVGGLRNNLEVYNKIPLWLHLMATYISLLSPALDPIIVMRNQDFRKVIESIINKHKRIPSLSKKKEREFRRNSSFSLPVCQERDGEQPRLKAVAKLSQKSRDSVLNEEVSSTNSLSQTEEPIEAIPVAIHVYHVNSTESPE